MAVINNRSGQRNTSLLPGLVYLSISMTQPINYNVVFTQHCLYTKPVLEVALCINSIILLTKKVIYNSMKEEKQPHVLLVKNEMKMFISKKNTGSV